MEVFLFIYDFITRLSQVYGGYYIILGVIGLLLYRFKYQELKRTKKKNNFAIIVAARNEETVIGNLIDSLNNLKYDKDYYKVYVVINNTTDNTKKVSLEHGANVLECKSVVKSKADALRFAFKKLKDNKDIDAYVFFDADNIVHPDFLTHMNDVLNNGYRVASSFRDAKNPSDSFISSSYTVFYYIQSLFFCRSRLVLNGNSSITGTGFMVKKELIDAWGFNTKTLTEDLEFACLCTINNERIYYAENAITYDEYPTSFKTSWIQRKRWSSGNIECAKLYTGKLLKSFLKNGKIAPLDFSFILWGLIAQVIVYLNMMTFRIVNLAVGNPLIMQDYVGFAFAFIVQMILPLLTCIILKKKIRKLWKGILFFPIFILTWFPINIICLFKKDDKWVEIKHDRNITLEDIK